MSQQRIPDSTETELWIVRTTLKERCGREIEPRQADTGIMPGGGRRRRAGQTCTSPLFWGD